MAADKGATTGNKETNLSTCTLFVRNLPFAFDNKQLENVFSEVGPVKRCFVVKDNANPEKCRGFGYVTYALKEDAVLAQEKIRQVNGRKLFISFSNKKPRHIERGPPQKKKDEIEGDNVDTKNTETVQRVIVPPSAPEAPVKPKHKPKSERSSAMSSDGRTVVVTGFNATLNIKQLKKACKRSGETEQFIYPVENESQPTAHVVYKSHKDARKAVKNLQGKIVKGQVLNSVLRSKQDKSLSQKSLKKSRLIVRNLPFKCSKDLLSEKFSKFGETSEIVLPTKMVGKNKKKLGFAFVQFHNVFDAKNALEGMNSTEIKGRAIKVDWTLPKKKYELLKVSEGLAREDDDKEQVEDVVSEKYGEDEQSDEDDNDKQSEDEISEDYSDKGNIDSSENGDGDDNLGGGEDSEDEAPAKKKRKLRDAREGKTIFIRNLPFDATEEEISALVESFGEIAYCKIVVDSATEHSRGSAFVKFEEKQSADDCLKKHGDETKGSEELSLRKRPLSVTLAVTKGKMPKLLAEKDTTKKSPRDKRSLYLAREGVIAPGSEAAAGLSKSDLQKRQKAIEEKKSKLKMPHFIVSKTRLCIRNLPLNVDDKKLSSLLRTVAEGKPKIVQKVRIMRNMERLDSSGVGRSKGFGFAQFACHEDALDVLRATNNNPKIFGPDRRPIVEFAIENNLILQRLEQRRNKNFQKVKANRESSKHEVNGNKNKRKRERNETSERKRVKKNENVNENSVDISGQLEQHSSAFKVRSFKNRQGRKKENNMKGLPESGETFAESKRNNLKSKVGMGSSSAKTKINKVDLEEQRFNQIVEKYKTKLFGENSKQLKASRWFDS